MLSALKSSEAGVDVISIGAATVDIFVKSPQFVVKKSKNSPTGSNLTLPCSFKAEISDSLIASGGGATNSAVSFSRLGLHSACLARTGKDNFHRIIRQELKKEGVKNYISTPKGDKTDFSVVLVTADGARSVLTNRGDTSLEENDLDWKILSQTKWLYITSLEGNLDLLEKIIGFCHDEGIKIALNPGNRELALRRQLLPLLPYVDFLLLNTTESQLLMNSEFNSHHFLDKLAHLGSQIVAVTDGRNGAYVVTTEDKFYSPIINTTPIDETGAGDSFGSAFVAALMYGCTPQEALTWGITNSASVVSALGAKPGLLNYQQIIG